MRQRVLLWTFLFATLEAQTVPKPRNLTLWWKSVFNPVLSWTPEKNCSYEIEWRTRHEKLTVTTKNSSRTRYIAMNGNYLHFYVTAICSNRRSERAHYDVTYPELVKDPRCYIVSSRETRCSWRPTNYTKDVAFFYKLVNEKGAGPLHGDIQQVRECPSYEVSGQRRSGCVLRMAPEQSLHMVFKGTGDEEVGFNTYQDRRVKVKPAALNLRVWSNLTDKLLLRWDPPDVLALDQWQFIVNYTECSEKKRSTVTGKDSMEIPRVAHCPYRIQIGGHTRDRGDTEWSEEVRVGAAVGNRLVSAAILAPLLFGVLTVMAFACCRKNKEKIFPKIPKPRNLLSDIYDNNKNHLYAPSKEEDFNITLVVEPSLPKPGT